MRWSLLHYIVVLYEVFFKENKKGEKMNFTQYQQSSDKESFRILISWKGNRDLSRLEIAKDLKKYYQASSDNYIGKSVLLAHTKKDTYILPKMKNEDNWAKPEDIELSWVKINSLNEDGSLNCETTSGPFSIDNDFKVGFAHVYDFLFWEELLNDDGCLSDLAIKLIANRP